MSFLIPRPVWSFGYGLETSSNLDTLTLNNSTLPENADQGATFGTLQGVTDDSLLELVDNAGGRAQLVGRSVQRGPVALDYEAATSHTIIVRETLAGRQNSPNETQITLNVANVLDAPALNALTLTATSLVEGASQGTFVGSVQGKTIGSTLVLTDAAGGRFQLTGTSLEAGPTLVDFEEGSSYSITITEILPDAPNSPNDNEVAIDIVNVAEVTLAALTGTFALSETAPQGASAGAIGGKTAGSSLSLVDDAGGRVALSGTTIVRGATALDHEAETSHSFTVRETYAEATNSPRDTTFTLTVSNVLEAASLSALSGTFSLAENAANGAQAGTVSGKTAGSTLTLIDTAGGRVQLTGTNILRGATPLDYETATSHSFTIRETLADSPNSPRDTILTLTVTDVADVGSLNELSGDFTLIENAAQGTVAGTLLGTSTTSGSTLSLLDSAGGRVQLVGSSVQRGPTALDYETNTSHTFTVRETLGGASNSPRDTVLTLAVQDIDDTAPVFTSANPSDTFPESDGLIGWTVTWNDPTATLAFVGDDAVDLVVTSLTPTAASVTFELDYEVKASYSFDQVLTDPASLTATQSIVLTITNVDPVTFSVAPAISGVINDGQIASASSTLAGGTPTEHQRTWFRAPADGSALISLLSGEAGAVATITLNAATQGWAYGDELVLFERAKNTEEPEAQVYVRVPYVGGGVGVPSLSASLPTSGHVGQAISVTVDNPGGGATPITWSGKYPPGLSITASNDTQLTISGTLEALPTATGATDAASGATTATVTVATNKGNGTLYWFISTSPTTPSSTALKAGTGAVASGSQNVTTTGTQTVNVTGLTASTTYYAHFLYRDAWGFDSAATSANGFTTSAPPDTIAPTLSSAVDNANGSDAASISVNTNEANGTLYWFVSTSASPPTTTALKAGTGAAVNGSQSVTATGLQGPIAVTGLTSSSTYYAHFVHTDAAGNNSVIVSGNGFTTASSGGPAMDATLTSAIPSNMTFVRSSEGSRNASSGLVAFEAVDAPRFDHVFGSSTTKGYLSEEQRTNTLQYTINLHSAYWAYSGGTPATYTWSYAPAPDGTMSAVRIQGTIGSSFVQKTSVASNGQTKSIWARLPDSWPSSTATTYIGGRSGQSKYLVTLTKVWQRFSFPVVTGETNGANFIPVDFRNASTTATDVLLWGAQLETGLFATSTILCPSSSTVARTGDNLAITGSDFTSIWNASAGTLVFRGVRSPASGYRMVGQISDGTDNHRITLFTVDAVLWAEIHTGGVVQASLSIGAITADTPFNVALAFAANDIAASLNGGAVLTDATATLPTVSQMNIARGWWDGSQLCGHVAGVKLYGTRRTNVTLQADAT